MIDIVQMLTQQADYQTVRKCWNKLNQRPGEAGSQPATNFQRLKMTTIDGKKP